ncbi:hypothetical protein D3C78_1751840 [compost metagenome]
MSCTRSCAWLMSQRFRRAWSSSRAELCRASPQQTNSQPAASGRVSRPAQARVMVASMPRAKPEAMAALKAGHQMLESARGATDSTTRKR